MRERERQAWIREWTDQLYQERVCFRCWQPFRLADSLGHVQCRYHPCPYDDKKHIFPCCGRSRLPSSPMFERWPIPGPGCTPIDHSDVLIWPNENDPNAIVRIPALLLPILHPREDLIVHGENRDPDVVVLRRFLQRACT